MQNVGEQFRADMVEEYNQDETGQPDVDVAPDAHDRAGLLLSLERLHEVGTIAQGLVGLLEIALLSRGNRRRRGKHGSGIVDCLQDFDGTVKGAMHVIQASQDSATYLQKELVREVGGEKEIPVSEVTKTFNPFEASFYLSKMSQMLETIKATRLKALKGGGPVESINTFFGLDRDEVRQLAKHDEWKQTPARADEARAYNQLVAQMKARAEQQKAE